MRKNDSERVTSPRVRQKRQNIRKEILLAAEEILVNEGVDGITLASVAGALGLTKQALYHYFRSKDALIRSLTTELLNNEIEYLISVVEKSRSASTALGDLIRAFYKHYIGNLEAFRFVYCQSQLLNPSSQILDEETIRDEINPRTRKLFDLLEELISDNSKDKRERARMRRLAFSAWLSALGLMTMLSLAKSTGDPLIHSDSDLIDTLAAVFDGKVVGGSDK